MDASHATSTERVLNLFKDQANTLNALFQDFQTEMKSAIQNKNRHAPARSDMNRIDYLFDDFSASLNRQAFRYYNECEKLLQQNSTNQIQPKTEVTEHQERSASQNNLTQQTAEQSQHSTDRNAVASSHRRKSQIQSDSQQKIESQHRDRMNTNNVRCDSSHSPNHNKPFCPSNESNAEHDANVLMLQREEMNQSRNLIKILHRWIPDKCSMKILESEFKLPSDAVTEWMNQKEDASSIRNDHSVISIENVRTFLDRLERELIEMKQQCDKQTPGRLTWIIDRLLPKFSSIRRAKQRATKQ